jgi:hypothetical protein
MPSLALPRTGGQRRRLLSDRLARKIIDLRMPPVDSTVKCR